MVGGAFTLTKVRSPTRSLILEKTQIITMCIAEINGRADQVKQGIWQNAPVEICIYKACEKKQKIAYDVAFPVP